MTQTDAGASAGEDDLSRQQIALELVVARRRAAVAVDRLRQDVSLNGSADRDLTERARVAVARVTWLMSARAGA
jgi:hypothetical protein